MHRQWQDSSHNSSLVIEPLDGPKGQPKLNCKTAVCRYVCESAHCSVKFYRRDHCSLVITYQPHQKRRIQKVSHACTAIR